VRKIFGGLVLLLACGRGEADAIREQLSDDDYRNTYARAPGWPERKRAAGGPHGAFIDLYINDVVQEVVDAGDPIERWPEGALIVKDGWNDEAGSDYEYLSFMERRAEGWLWGEYRRGRRLVSAGLNDGTCTGCHASGADSVRAFGFPPYE
jgi:hypothetical protein